MSRASVSAIYGLLILASSSCTTEACDCPPAIVPAVVTGHVLEPSGAAGVGAVVRAYSAAETGCHSLDTDFGIAVAETDGGFRMGLASGQLQDSVCVLVFAQPRPGSEGLENSDTNLVIMDFRDELTRDSARVELVLRAAE
jgi:hypothetical protein